VTRIRLNSTRGETPAGDDGHKPLVLVVDDQPINIQTLYQILRDDYDVGMATSGQGALAFCDTRRPDLILLDVVMPEMDGYEVCRRLKGNELTAPIPIVFVTAQDNPAEEARALDEGAADFISKPFHEKVVKARVRTQMTLKLQAEKLRALATTDALTRTANRRQFDTALAVQWAQCMRSRAPLAVIMVDIDHFKRYNDTYGHPAGDACLQAVAAALHANLRRPQDLVARYGGEEFACVLPDTPLNGAHERALELEQAVRGLCIAHEKSDMASVVTISLGVAAVIPTADTDPGDLVAAADRMLYAAKQGGRGQVKSVDPHG
jgi:diguanylate cyclase (GGDEF)-like protein